MKDKNNPKKYNFELSLSVLNHLGRNLYRNFVTVLGEAISEFMGCRRKERLDRHRP